MTGIVTPKILVGDTNVKTGLVAGEISALPNLNLSPVCGMAFHRRYIDWLQITLHT